MLEFHGWLTVFSSPGETETELEDDVMAIERLRTLVDKLNAPPGLVDLRTVNGQGQWHFGGSTNHRTHDVDDLLSLVRDIARAAPGSYGLVYLHDDESDTKSNEFSVLVVSRGRVVEHKDPFLSPVIPVVEDSET